MDRSAEASAHIERDDLREVFCLVAFNARIRVGFLIRTLAICLFFPVFVIAQDTGQETRLLGPVGDGSPRAPVEMPLQPAYRIESSHTIRLPDCKLTIRRVLPPVLVAAEKMPSPEAVTEATTEDEIHESELLFVSAHVYQERLTHLTWWMEGQQHSAWTDINFHNFSGITSFAHKNRAYALIMSVGGDDTMPVDAWKPRTPGSFLLAQEDADNPKAVNVAEAFAALYAQEKDTLIAARLGREESARKAAAVMPAPLAGIVLTFWDKPSRPLTAAEKAERDMEKETAR